MNAKYCVKCHIKKPKDDFYKKNGDDYKTCTHCRAVARSLIVKKTFPVLDLVLEPNEDRKITPPKELLPEEKKEEETTTNYKKILKTGAIITGIVTLAAGLSTGKIEQPIEIWKI